MFAAGSAAELAVGCAVPNDDALLWYLTCGVVGELAAAVGWVLLVVVWWRSAAAGGGPGW